MDTTATPPTENITVKGQAPTADKSHLWVGDHFSFHDILDAINPLQHIPVVSTIYRAVTGDTLGNASRVVGDGLYGGVIGVIAGLVDVSVIENTGKDIGGNIMSALGLDGDPGTPQSASAYSPSNPSPTGSTAPVPDAVPIPAQKPTPPPAAAPAVAQTMAQAAAPAPSGIPLAPTQSQLMPLNNTPKMMALNSQSRAFPIDTSAEGILALRTTANSAPRPVPLNIPAGTLAPNQRIPLTGAEFAQRMSDGLDKYKALVEQREASGAGTSVNQVQ